MNTILCILILLALITFTIVSVILADNKEEIWERFKKW